MSEITIPPAALEAGARVIREERRSVYSDEGLARAACLAMLRAWPGVLTERRARCDAVVLPFNLDADLILPLTENPDAEA